MSFRASIKKVHLWLGLSSGLVVFILGVTGALFVFHQEITQWPRYDLRHADVVKSRTLPLSQLHDRLAQVMGVKRLRYGITSFRDPARNWQAVTFRRGEDNWTYFGSIKDYRTGYINPYTGRVAGIVNEEQDFFQIVKGIHWSLLLAEPIGQPIVACSALIFSVMLLSGLILWWPRRWNRSGRQGRFRTNCKAPWKRLNIDLHRVLGFYALVVLLVIGFTGLYWYFPFVQKTFYFLGTGDFTLPESAPSRVANASPASQTDGETPLAKAYAIAWSRFPEADAITFTLPGADGKTIEAQVQPAEGRYDQPSVLLFDSQSGRLVKQRLYSEMNAGEKLLAMNYDLHVGSIGGLCTKLLVFVAGLIAAGLPVTGFLYWYPTWKHKRRSRQQRKSAIAEGPAGY
ncbi:MAG: PepSY domain-containing protein [Nitrococcus sp.]|nr:PepSY domain-containing protein [Nitrococcus sp.]